MKANRHFSAFDGYVRRLQASANPSERDSIFFGHTLHHEYPVLVPTELLFEHVHILGAPGTGKTALGLAPMITQLIRRGDGPVIVLDMKGDMSLFNTVRLEAGWAGRKFKWFTNKPERSTYVFNPWRQSYLQRLTMPEILGLFMLSLNMHHGDDYGRAYFSIRARTFLHSALNQALDVEHGKPAAASERSDAPRSFIELSELLHEFAAGRDEYRHADHLLGVLQSLLDFPQLNLAPSGHGNQVAVSSGIHMPEVIRKRQVVYFYLQSLLDQTTVAEIARLVLYSVVSAAIQYRDETGRKPRVYLVADEAQILVAQNIANVLAQAREYQVACILAHQSLSQLNPPGGVDLRELVLTCTSVKQFWSARDPNVKDYISKISGEVGYYTASWDQLKSRVLEGSISRQYAASKVDEPKFIQISESVGPRLTSQDIEDHSRSQNTSIMAIERSAGLSCFQGAFPVHSDWIMPAAEYRRRNLEMGWPEPTNETISTTGIWPSTETEGGHSANSSPALANESVTNTAAEKLDALQRRIEQREKDQP